MNIHQKPTKLEAFLSSNKSYRYSKFYVELDQEQHKATIFYARLNTHYSVAVIEVTGNNVVCLASDEIKFAQVIPIDDADDYDIEYGLNTIPHQRVLTKGTINGDIFNNKDNLEALLNEVMPYVQEETYRLFNAVLLEQHNLAFSIKIDDLVFKMEDSDSPQKGVVYHKDKAIAGVIVGNGMAHLIDMDDNNLLSSQGFHGNDSFESADDALVALASFATYLKKSLTSTLL